MSLEDNAEVLMGVQKMVSIRLTAIVAPMILVVLVGCRENTLEERVETHTIPVMQQDQAITQFSALPEPNPQMSAPEDTKADLVLMVASIMPRPLQTEEDVQQCLAAAEESDRQIHELTGLRSEGTTRRLEDCVIQYDEDKDGYTKFYPDGVIARFFMRGHAADLNLRWPESDEPAIHITVTEDSSYTSCLVTLRPPGQSPVEVCLIRTSETAPFSRTGEWHKLGDPEVMEKLCMDVYSDYLKLKRN